MRGIYIEWKLGENEENMDGEKGWVMLNRKAKGCELGLMPNHLCISDLI